MRLSQPWMHVLSLLVLTGIAAVSMTSCDLLDHEEQAPEDSWIILTAVYNETLEDGAPIQRIVLVNFDDPSIPT